MKYLTDRLFGGWLYILPTGIAKPHRARLIFIYIQIITVCIDISIKSGASSGLHDVRSDAYALAMSRHGASECETPLKKLTAIIDVLIKTDAVCFELNLIIRLC